MIFLLIMILLPWISPLVWWVIENTARSSKIYLKFFDFAVLGIILTLFIPHHFAHDGWHTFLYIALGWLVFSGLELVGPRLPKSTHISIIILALVLSLHGFADGIGLAISLSDQLHNPQEQASKALLLSILLHRLPTSMGLWKFTRPHHGKNVAFLFFTCLSVSTTVGYIMYSFDNVFHLNSEQTHILEYLIAGGLLHFGVLKGNPQKLFAAGSKKFVC